MPDDPLRAHVLRLLDWREAHVGFEAAIAGIPAEARGRRPGGLPYSPWELLEHMRLAQRDILDFCTKPSYEARAWPDDYWPASGSAPSEEDWEASVASFRADLDALKGLAREADLFAPVPGGTGQTYLRELLLVADHNAYHVGQLVTVRRLLGTW
jgi:uncharacterized damage-inducible protein DinB